MNAESLLQSKIVISFADKYPERRGRLFATFQETRTPIEGARKLSLGLIPGASDFVYTGEHEVIFIEMKAEGMKHPTAHLKKQAQWGLSIRPHRYYFCDSEECFWNIIDGDGLLGITPERVLAWLSTAKAGSVIWRRENIPQNLEYSK